MCCNLCSLLQIPNDERSGSHTHTHSPKQTRSHTLHAKLASICFPSKRMIWNGMFTLTKRINFHPNKVVRLKAETLQSNMNSQNKKTINR